MDEIRCYQPAFPSYDSFRVKLRTKIGRCLAKEEGANDQSADDEIGLHRCPTKSEIT
jgi:hypothetical protein